MMPSRTRRRRWQDVDKEDVRLDSVLQLYLMSFTRLSRSSGRPTTRLRHDYWYSDGDYDIPLREHWIRLLTIHPEDAAWLGDELKRVGIPRAELVRQAIERLHMDRQRGVD
jgi:hypothetical protein